MGTGVSSTFPALRDVAADPPLALSYLPGQGDTLVISLSGVGTKRSEQPPLEFFKLASQAGQNHVLFVSDASRSWMNGPGLARQIVAAIEETADRSNATRIVALGNSMGATMALHLAGLTRIDTVIAFVPQFSVHPNRMPKEKRWSFFRKQIKDWPFDAITDLHADKADIRIFHGGSPDERIHLDHFPRDPRAKHFVFPDMDHKLAFRLHKERKLERIVEHAIAGRPWKLHRAVEDSGGMLRETFDQTLPQGI
ncbi:alpha/beta hydrolase family protein [Roseovarius sp. S1116L3]|uniref:alpha/beta hydrolase family protein n=1 Tax=Roseovarius roseus TaxID=3342636 RepID=UPI00372B4A88